MPTEGRRRLQSTNSFLKDSPKASAGLKSVITSTDFVKLNEQKYSKFIGQDMLMRGKSLKLVDSNFVSDSSIPTMSIIGFAACFK